MSRRGRRLCLPRSSQEHPTGRTHPVQIRDSHRESGLAEQLYQRGLPVGCSRQRGSRNHECSRFYASRALVIDEVTEDHLRVGQIGKEKLGGQLAAKPAKIISYGTCEPALELLLASIGQSHYPTPSLRTFTSRQVRAPLDKALPLQVGYGQVEVTVVQLPCGTDSPLEPSRQLIWIARALAQHSQHDALGYGHSCLPPMSPSSRASGATRTSSNSWT